MVDADSEEGRYRQQGGSGHPWGRPGEDSGEMAAFAERLESAVCQRTAELSETIARLEQELACRRQAGLPQEITQRERLAELEDICNHLPVGVCVLDTQFRYVMINTFLAELNGVAAEAHYGRTVREVLPKLADLIEPVLHQVLQSGEPVLDLEISGRDQREPARIRYCLASYYPLKRPGGRLSGIGTVIRDVTVQRAAEERLRQSQQHRLEVEKLAAAGRMAARIAHEINNPLAGIRNAFLLIKKAVPVDHPRHEFVGLIEKEIDRIAQIVRQMYDLHRPNQDVEKEILVADAIRDVVTMLAPVCRRHRVTIEVDLPDPRLVVCLPEGSLRQVLYNLLDNAVDASPYDSVVKIDVHQAEDTLWIRIADKGGGIPKELQSRIFEPFFTTKERGASGGLGLGLAICQGIVEALEGSIEVQSEVGQGSVFCVKLPFHRRSQSSRGRATGIDPVGG